MMTNIELLDFFRSGFYEDFWAADFKENENESLARDILNLLNANSGHILDWGGGWGRISKYFAKSGFDVTILDFNRDYLQKAEEDFENEGLTVNTVCADFKETPEEIQADFTVCVFNTVGFMDDINQSFAFANLKAALKPDGKFLFDCVNRVYLEANFKEESAISRMGLKYIHKRMFDKPAGILKSEFIIKDKNNNFLNRKKFEQRIYTTEELTGMLNDAGFTHIQFFGSYKAKKLSPDSPQIIVLAV